jgi:hypothetical protein
VGVTVCRSRKKLERGLIRETVVELYLENAGRAFYKTGNYKDSIFFLGMAISMDAKPAITYLHRVRPSWLSVPHPRASKIKRAIWKDIVCSTAIRVLLPSEFSGRFSVFNASKNDLLQPFTLVLG